VKIGVHKNEWVGDSVLLLRPLFALRKLYPKSKITLFTSKIGAQILKNCSLIDELIDLSQKDFLNALNESNLDILLCESRWEDNLSLIAKSNVKKVIIRPYKTSFLNPKFKFCFVPFKNKIHEHEILLRLIRKIDKKHFDKHIKNINFSDLSLENDYENEENINTFLQTIKADKFKKIIAINAFGKDQEKANLDIQCYIELAKFLAKAFPQFLFLTLNHQNNNFFFEEFKEHNIKNFINDSDLLNLVALTKRLDLLISVDTGNVHIADVCKKPCVNLIQKKFALRWRGGVYGSFYEAVLLDKNFKKDYAKYKKAFFDKAFAACKLL